MKCASCGTDVKKKDRPDRRCPNCKRTFVFDPQNGDILTDVGFQHALDRVSANGKVRWHREHLYAELRRRTRRDTRRSAIVGALVGGASLIFAMGLGLLAVLTRSPVVGAVVPLLLVVGAVAMLMSAIASFRNRPGLERAAAGELVSRWEKAYNLLPGVIEVAGKAVPLSSELEAELEHYSFDRAVITDSPMIVDTLIANNFHFENNCAVLSVGGYPKHTFAILRRMIRQNPRIQVFALHDATPRGCALAERLRSEPDWFAGIGTVVDVGLRPVHARFFPGMEEGPEEGPMGQGITPAEADWLRKHSLRLAVVRPEQLVKRLFRGITEVESGAATGDAVFYLGMDSGSSDGGGDSFG